ncbi:MAG: type IV secretion system protein [Candidatus Saccharibacteria bacterium]|nr:type IV secretion system protein [Candidatus Saccharibacteria bacterium]
MSTSGHTNSDGAKSRRHGFLFKKIRLGAIVFLAFALTIVGSVGSTVLADPTNNGGTSTEKVISPKETWEAKYYASLLASCLYKMNRDDSHDSFDTRTTDKDDALTLSSALKGVIEGDTRDNNAKVQTVWDRYDWTKQGTLKTDSLLGTHSYCNSTIFGSSGNKGLIAATIESFVAIRNKSSSVVKNDLTWEGLGNLGSTAIYEKGRILCALGLEPGNEVDTDYMYYEKSEYKNKECYERIAIANDDIGKGGNDIHLNTTCGTFDGCLSKVKDLLREYNNTQDYVNNLALTKYEQYYQYAEAYKNRCSKYNGEKSEYGNTYYYPVVTKGADNYPRLVRTEFFVPSRITESDFANANFIAFDGSNKYELKTDKLSCRADAPDKVWLYAMSTLKENAKREYKDVCAVDYETQLAQKRKVVDSIKTTKFDEIGKIRKSVQTNLKFNGDDGGYVYNCLYSYTMNNNGAYGNYYCNLKYRDKYLEDHKEEIEENSLAFEKVESAARGGDYANCFHMYEERPDTDPYGYNRYKCNKDMFTSNEAARNENIEIYNAVVKAQTIFGPIEEIDLAEENVTRQERYYDKKIEYVNKALDDLISVDTVKSSAGKLSLPGYDHQLPEGAQPKVTKERNALKEILIGIEHFEENNKENIITGCGSAEYIESHLPKDWAEVTGDNTKLENRAASGSLVELDEVRNLDPSATLNIDTTETCEGQVVMGWVICQAARFMTDAASKIYDSISETWIAMDRKETSQESGTYTVWQSFVNIANIILVILFLFVIFSQLTGYGIDNYGIKRVLPKLIMVAILINLSFIICQIVVDVTNIIGVNIEGFLDNIEVGSSSLYESPGDGGIVNFIGNLLAVAGLGAVGIGVTFKVLDHNLLSFLFGALIILLVVLIAILFFFVQLGIRKAAVITLIAISPLAIVCYALPNTKKYFDKWLNGFKALMLVYPMCGLVQGMSRLIARMMSDASSSFIGAVVIAAILVFPYFFIPSLVAKAVSAVTSLGERMSQLGRGIRKRATDGIKNTEHYKEAQDRRKDAEALRRGTTREAIEQRHRRRNGVDATQVADAEAQRRAAINTLSDPNSSIADRRRARRELAAANRTLGRAKDIQKYEDNYLNKQKEAQETAARAGYQGDYVATMDAAQGRAAQNAFNVKMGDAENLSPEITIEMARHQARTRVEDTQLSLEKQEREYALKGGDNDAARDLYIATMRRQQNINTDSEFNKRLGQARATTGLDRVSLEEATNAARMHQQDERISRERNRLEYNARQDYGAANGIDYEEVMTNSLAPGVESEFNTKIAQAENPAAAVSLATARSRVSSKRRSESYQAYFDQFSSLTPAQQKAELTRLISQQGTGTGDTNMDDVRALADVMVKMGASDDVQEVLGAAIGSANFSTANWEEIRNNQTKLDSYIEIMGKTGSISGKGFAKYLAKMTAAGNQANAVSYEEWIRGGATGNAALTANDDLQYNSFEAFVDNNYQGGDVVDKMSKNEMKFIISQTNREDRRTPAVPDGSRTISKLDVGELKKGAIGKTGDELRYANEMIALKKTDFTSTIGPGHSAVDFYNQLNLGPAEIAKLDLTTLIAIVGEDPNDPTKPNPVALTAFTATISDSLTRARSDPRISHNLRDERVRQYLNL